MPTSTGTYENQPEPGPVVTVTDPGGGDQSRSILVTMQWNPNRVNARTPVPRAGCIYDMDAGWCEWFIRTGLGSKPFRIPMTSNGRTSNVYAEVVNVRNGSVWTNDHTIVVPPPSGPAKINKPRRKKAKARRKGKKARRKGKKARRKGKKARRKGKKARRKGKKARRKA